MKLESWIVTKSKLINCWNWKPLLNGKELLTKYEKNGLAQDSRLGKLNQFILNQRLSKPNTTTNDLDDKTIEIPSNFFSLLFLIYYFLQLTNESNIISSHNRHEKPSKVFVAGFKAFNHFRYLAK